MRARLAAVLGRGEPQRERAELERLDQTATELAATPVDHAEIVSAVQMGMWRARFEQLLEAADERDRASLVRELESVISDAVPAASQGDRVWHGSVKQDAKASGHARVFQIGQGDLNVTES
ncbi:hypothetical protein ACQUSR_01800 [Streptomyces sp. P1-3]|uniref:hypothetical protein n=1 Tax=Streptomyces sp. P1-3 TaxID=3421658 RepID=UPI003D35FBCC